MDKEVHCDLQKATQTLSYQHGVDSDKIVELIVNKREPKELLKQTQDDYQNETVLQEKEYGESVQFGHESIHSMGKSTRA